MGIGLQHRSAGGEIAPVEKCPPASALGGIANGFVARFSGGFREDVVRCGVFVHRVRPAGCTAVGHRAYTGAPVEKCPPASVLGGIANGFVTRFGGGFREDVVWCGVFAHRVRPVEWRGGTCGDVCWYLFFRSFAKI